MAMTHNTLRVKYLIDEMNKYEAHLDDGIYIDPPYQREDVTNSKIKASMIEAIYQDMMIHSIVLRDSVTSPGVLEVLDGKQRLTAIREHYELLKDIADKATGEEKIKKIAEFKIFGSLYIRCVSTGPMSDLQAHAFFTDCNRNTTKMKPVEELAVYYKNDSYKAIMGYTPKIQELFATPLKRKRDLAFLIRSYMAIASEKLENEKVCIDKFKSYMADGNEKISVENMTKTLSSFVTTLNFLFKENENTKFKTPGDILIYQLVSIAAIIEDRHVSRYIRIFVEKYPEFFKSDRKTLVEKHHLSSESGGQFQILILKKARELFAKMTIEPRLFNSKKTPKDDSCAFCGSKNDLQLDHVIPYSLGGDTSIENVQTLCKACNTAKGNSI